MKNYKRLFFILAILFLLFLFWFFIIGISTNKPGAYFNKGSNAIWIEHRWVGEFVPESEIRDFVKTMQKRQIKTVFVHSGPIKVDGTIDKETYEYALHFLENAKKFDKDIEYQAWLGQIRSKIDLADPYIRSNISKESMILTEFVGFDGIHFDIEPVWDGDLDFIKLLEETKNKISETKKISVALAEFIPESVIWLFGDLFKFTNYNTEISYLNCSKYADQIAIMVYDTGINHPRIYEWLVKEQIIWMGRLLKDTEFFIGLPSYSDIKPGFDPKVENLYTGLRGSVKGLNDVRSKNTKFKGIAIYSYWETNDFEWAIYDKMWIENP